MRNYTFIRFAILVALRVCVIVAFTVCIRYGYVPSNVLQQYYLGDEKIPAKITDEDFEDDMVIVYLKKSPTQYNPTISDFAFYNIDYIEYLSKNSERRCLFVYLKQKGKDKVLEAVKYFDSLSIVHSVHVSGYSSLA